MRLAGSLPIARKASVRALRNPRDGSLLDRALVLVFPGPATATGEDLVEFHVHGGRAVVAAVERVLSELPGLRAALPGEFTRRALMAGRIDLTEAEGLGDLLAAETESQRRAALMAAEGGIRRRVELWSEQLMALSARVEAELDFSDEDDVASADIAAISTNAAALADEISAIVDAAPVERLHHGIRVVLAGPPNSGKSTLLNALVDRDAAIVSPIAGTTRDRIEVSVQRGGIAYLITDTAGLTTETDDPIERIGIVRAQAAIDTADIVLWLGEDAPPAGAIALHPRSDLPGREITPTGRVPLSAATGSGMTDLWLAIEHGSKALLPREDEIALNQRQRALAAQSASALRTAGVSDDLLVVAEELRTARGALDQITGHSDTEAMLDALFGKFCIGK